MIHTKLLSIYTKYYSNVVFFLSSTSSRSSMYTLNWNSFDAATYKLLCLVKFDDFKIVIELVHDLNLN